MSTTDDAVTILPEHECWDLMAGVALGRLVTSADGQPEIFPVNFVVQHTPLKTPNDYVWDRIYDFSRLFVRST